MQCAGTWRKGGPMQRIRNLSFVFVREMPFCDKQNRRNVSGREDWSSPYFVWLVKCCIDPESSRDQYNS